jgi:hypothetical protein
MPKSEDRARLIERYCARDDLTTFDPYDIWKTPVGLAVKDLFNRHRVIGALPAALLTLFDTYVNNETRWFYRPQEYPIVRAWAALALLNLHERQASPWMLVQARGHLEWLRQHASQGYSGPCWGIGFRQPISKGLVYEAELPLATMTPYPLEAFVRYHQATGDEAVVPVIRGIYEFFDRDIPVMEETAEYLVTAYSARRDRRVVNAVSYVLFALALLLPYLSPAQQDRTRARIGKLYRYLELSQRPDGSWLYSPDGPPFIDCFHSCIVLKNLIRAGRLVALPGAREVIGKGYDYVLRSFRVPGTGLFGRFSLANKPSLVRFDLYDNAEVMNLATLMDDKVLASSLADAIGQAFHRGADIYSQVDRFGVRHNRNTLRWAVMPYLFALSTLPS